MTPLLESKDAGYDILTRAPTLEFEIEATSLDVNSDNHLGYGKNSVVIAGSLKATATRVAREVAVKCIPIMSSNLLSLACELEVGRLVRNTNLVQMFGYSLSSDGTLSIVMERLEMSLRERLVRDADLALPDRLRWLCDIAAGMQALHRNRPCIIHRDLKPENVLLTCKTGEAIAKIADFGLAKAVTDCKPEFVGTPGYMAPELFDDEAASTKSDVFSFAIVMCNLLTLKDPYANLEHESAMHGMVMRRFRPMRETDEAGHAADRVWWNKRHPLSTRRPNATTIPDTPEENGLKALMETCWADEPVERPTFGAILDRLHQIAGTVRPDHGITCDAVPEKCHSHEVWGHDMIKALMELGPRVNDY